MAQDTASGQPAKVLTVAGSDSGGAAGLQADLKTFATLGVYGTSVVTVVTAQNSTRVQAVQSLPADLVAAQFDAILSDYGATGQGIASAKTGFIGRPDLIETIAAKLRQYRLQNVIVDPVLVNYKGEAMFPATVTQATISHLLPLAHLATPNRYEAALLVGLPAAELKNTQTMETAAAHIHSLGPQNVLVKGGRQGDEIVDVLYDGHCLYHLSMPWLDTPNTRGSGDILSAAICAFLAQGEAVKTAVSKAQQFTATAIQNGARWQLVRGQGPVGPLI